MNCVEAGRLLDPYLDDELGQTQSEQLQVHISTCASCSQRLAEREGLSRLIRTLPYAAAPDRLRNEIASVARRHHSRVWLLKVAATFALAAAAGAGLLVIRGMLADRYAEAAVTAHVRSLGAGPLVDVRSSDRHSVKPWFQGKLDFAPPVEDTAAAGFPLIGGRIDRLGRDSVAALVYQRRLHTISVFVRPVSARDNGDITARTVRGFEVRHWNHARMSFWIVSDLNDAELDQFVRALQGASP